MTNKEFTVIKRFLEAEGDNGLKFYREAYINLNLMVSIDGISDDEIIRFVNGIIAENEFSSSSLSFFGISRLESEDMKKVKLVLDDWKQYWKLYTYPVDGVFLGLLHSLNLDEETMHKSGFGTTVTVPFLAMYSGKTIYNTILTLVEMLPVNDAIKLMKLIKFIDKGYTIFDIMKEIMGFNESFTIKFTDREKSRKFRKELKERGYTFIFRDGNCLYKPELFNGLEVDNGTVKTLICTKADVTVSDDKEYKAVMAKALTVAARKIDVDTPTRESIEWCTASYTGGISTSDTVEILNQITTLNDR